MIQVEEWAEIRRLHRAEGRSIRAIAREFGLARNTVRAAVRASQPPRYARARRGSIVDPVEEAIRRELRACPTMPTTVIAERIGWTRGLTVLRERVRELRPVYRPPDPYQRTQYQPGELAQWDIWFPPVAIPVEGGEPRVLPVWVGVLGYSRVSAAWMIPSRETHDVLEGHWRCLEQLGGVPRLGVYDGEGAIGQRRGSRVRLSDAFQRFRGVLGMGVHVLRPAHPEGKGVVERTNGYFETSFLPGRDFVGVDDFNAQLVEWLETRAQRRVHRTIRARPCDRLAEDRAAMLPLPPVAPDVRWRKTVRLGRDHYVRVDTCDYSVHPRAIGARVEVERDLACVVVRRGQDEVARHRRSLAPHRTITDPAHVEARREQRRLEVPTPPLATDVELRDLAVYDHVLGAP
jgi:transposase